ncbi:MAG: nickel pincer cofactor biosynthesis protein LarC [Acidimicrobiales bacterium]
MNRRAPEAPGTAGTIAWFHCFAGIAGDMAFASLLDAGADFDEVLSILGRLPLPGWQLRREPVLRGGIGCTRVVVSSRDDVVVRTYAHIVGLVSEARLPERVALRSLAVFAALAEVEGRIHRRSVEQVHFHEVGGHDAVVDVVGTAAALEVLGVDTVTASTVATGTGTIRSAHGILPNPSPAVVRLLADVPTYGRDTQIELTTPTGAAILSALADSFGPMPPMVVASSGFGAGSNEMADLPNCTQVVVGQAIERTGPGVPDIGPGQPVIVLETNLDDTTGEQLGRAVVALLDAGAHDAWITPVVMKKGRPGHTLHALCDPALAGHLRQVFRDITGTFGVRALSGERWPSARLDGEVEVDGEPVRVKVSPGRVKAQFDDVARAADRTGLPLHVVASKAESAGQEVVPEVAGVDEGGDAPDPGGPNRPEPA